MYWLPEEPNRGFIYNKLREREFRSPRPYVPRPIAAYNRWHTVIDEFCWLLKVIYTPRHDLRRKRFRLDLMFANYLQAAIGDGNINQITIALGVTPTNDRIVIGDLRRGWYNELSFAMPLRESLIGLSSRDIELNHDISNNRFVFPSWRIVSAYYALYFFLRSVTLQKVSTVNVQRHAPALNAFKHNVIPALGSNIYRRRLILGISRFRQ